MKARLLLLILTTTLLSACATTAPIPSATPKAIDTVAPAASSTPTVGVTVTVQPPTETPEPTENPLLAAYNARATKVAEFPVTCELVQGGDHFISPNGNWLAAQCAPTEIDNHEQNIDTLEIVNRQSKHWAIHTKDYDLDIVRATQWSSDEKYLYFETRLNVDTYGGFACFSDSPGATGLYRLDLNNGTVSNVLLADGTLYNFAFSPTGRKLAYNSTILDLQTGEETNIHVDASIGTLTWSPDSFELAYATCEENPNGYGVNDDYAPKESAVKIYSIQQNASRTIFETKKSLLLIESWDSNNILNIYNQDEHYNTEHLSFDLNTNQWLTPTPTPQP